MTCVITSVSATGVKSAANIHHSDGTVVTTDVYAW
jgi:hypothetical protein